MTDDKDIDEHGFTKEHRSAADALYWRHVVARFTARARTDLLYAAALNKTEPPARWEMDSLKQQAIATLRKLVDVERESLEWVAETSVELYLSIKTPGDPLTNLEEAEVVDMRSIVAGCVSLLDQKLAGIIEDLNELAQLDDPKLSIEPAQRISKFLNEFGSTGMMLGSVSIGHGIPDAEPKVEVEVRPVNVDDPESMAALPEPVRRAFEAVYGKKP